MAMPGTVSTARPTRPGLRSLATAWAVSAAAFSYGMWLIGSSFYFNRFALESRDWAPWRLVDALEIAPQMAAWAVVGALALWWPRRREVIGAAVAAFLVVGAVSYGWVQHEASRAWHGTPVWPSAVLPFAFSARAVTLIPLGDAPSNAIPSRVLLLRDDTYQSVVYDPATHQVSWVGKDMAAWSVSAGAKRWAP